MTDKQLKKLSRLEILELLLEQTKINEQLRIEIDGLKNELNECNSIDTLGKLTQQLQGALENLNGQTVKMETLLSDFDRKNDNLPQPEEANENQPEKAEDATELKNENQPEKADEKPREAEITIKEQKRYSNINLYSRLMYFYYKNEDALNALPDDVQRDVREKLRGILNGEKK